MGLDQYAYVAARAGQRAEFWENAKLEPITNEWTNPLVSKPVEIAYWRKHPNLQGWMESLWKRKMHDANKDIPESDWESSFNHIELELTWADVDQLEQDIKSGHVASLDTTGFFFGNPSDEYYYKEDLEFCREAKANIFLGLKVFYNSSW